LVLQVERNRLGAYWVYLPLEYESQNYERSWERNSKIVAAPVQLLNLGQFWLLWCVFASKELIFPVIDLSKTYTRRVMYI